MVARREGRKLRERGRRDRARESRTNSKGKKGRERAKRERVREIKGRGEAVVSREEGDLDLYFFYFGFFKGRSPPNCDVWYICPLYHAICLLV